MKAPSGVCHKLFQYLWVGRAALALACLLTLTLFFTPVTHAANCTWLGGSDNWDKAANWSCGVVPGAGDSATIDSYGSIVSLTSAVNLGSLTLKNGTLGGSPNLAITGGFNWSGGTITGLGQMSLAAGSTSTLSGQLYLDGRTINNAGTVNIAGMQLFSNAAAWNNQPGGVLDFQADATWTGDHGANSVLTNNGTLKKSGGNAIMYIGTGMSATRVVFNNAGTVQVQSGTLQIDGGGASTGPITIGTGATLHLANTYDLNAGSDISGPGDVLFDPGPTKTVNLHSTYTLTGKTTVASGTLNIGAGAVIANIGDVLEITNVGTLVTAVPIQIANSMVWTGGTFKGPGALTIASGGNLTLSNSLTLDGASLNNNGTATSSGSLAFYFNNGAVWNNASNALLDLQADGQFAGNTGLDSTFNNSGTIRKSAGANTLNFGNSYSADLTLNNTGLIQAQKGRFFISGPFTQFSGTTLTGGRYEVSAVLCFNGADIVTNSASIILDGANAQIQGAVPTENGLAHFATNSATGQFTIRNGKNVTVPSEFTNAGSVTIEGASTFAVTSGNYVQSGGTTTLAGGTLAPAGIVNITGGTLAGAGTVNSSIVNAGIVSPGNPTGTLTVTGEYQQNGAGALNVELAGTGAGQFDQLNIAGAATIDGTLNVSRLNNFAPVTGDTFQVMSFGSGSGTFATTNGLSLGGGLALGVQYNPDNIKLKTGPAGLTLSSLNPAGALAGAADFVLTVNGTGFVSGSQVKWNDSVRTTTYVSSTQLKVQILAADIQAAGTATVTVMIPGGLTSDGLPFVVKAVQTPTSSVLHASVNPSVYGQSVTFTVDVTPGLPGGPVPTGKVTFYEVLSTDASSRQPVRQMALNGTSATFSFATSALMPGLHTIGAAYSGDSNYSASIAAPIKQTVNKAITYTDLTSSASSTFFGEPVTFTANVTIAAPGGGVLTGNVAFTSDGALIPGCEAMPADSGAATCSTFTLPVGSHAIAAQYSGSAQYMPSSGSLSASHQIKPFAPIKVTGVIYLDSNLNGSKQLVESVKGGEKVQLTNLVTGQISTTQSISGGVLAGTFTFSNVGWGTYRVRLILNPGMYQTSPNYPDFVAQGGVNVSKIYIGEVKGTDLSITMTSSATTAKPGDTVTYTIKVYNPGPFGAPSLSMQFAGAPKTTIVSVTAPTGALCNGDLLGLSKKCTMVGLGPTRTVVFTIKVKVLATAPVGTLLNLTASTSCSLYDPDKSNNKVTSTITVQ